MEPVLELTGLVSIHCDQIGYQVRSVAFLRCGGTSKFVRGSTLEINYDCWGNIKQPRKRTNHLVNCDLLRR